MYLSIINLTNIFLLFSLILAAPATYDPTKHVLATVTHTLCVPDHAHLTSSGFAVPPPPGSVRPPPDEQQEDSGFDTTTTTAAAGPTSPASSTGESVASTMVPVDPSPSSNAAWPVSQASSMSMASEFTWPTTPFIPPGGWGTTMATSRVAAATTTSAGDGATVIPSIVSSTPGGT
ncbi:hypothetical protein PTNB73_03773 [Pyrenophora teres f. teres]|uniref:Uncharacterized protein n=2 Tax=Pyrenophora teres f. teres TaxID=97479 RepID=E3RIR0_PYRTT|nr:hypothetical protein PTT_07941 [Pyrenophora teres f. teres 0-1]KAE8824412.1 hypothetical protein HRS9122_10346 [Pyrenophora teres f. teres]KAE8868720.1 hypothetical protein PTNB73_03773 [Pyrenophora teres f. teres]CAE7000001.1 hypothetical protein PTTW11_00988 [Pyrenophora teres f. teres]